MLDDYQKTTVDLLRHGECEGGRIFRGHTDVCLSDVGWTQMTGKVEWYLSRFPVWDAIVTSPLIRCKQFASKLAHEQHIALTEERDFREVSFGDWDGRLVDDVMDEQRDNVDAWLNNPANFIPPNGEATDLFQQRINHAFDRTVRQHSGRHVLVVCHGGVIRALLSAILAMPLAAMNRFEIDYACLSRIEVFKNSKNIYTRLAFHNIQI